MASYGGRNLISFRFEGSTDGLHWDMLFDDKDGLEIPETQPHWYAEPTSNTYGARIGGGFAFDDDLEPNSYASHSFATVGAANGGIFEVIGEPLTISGLEIDASAPAGAMSNIVFAAEGTVNVVNADVSGGAALELPGDYSELDGFANLSGWHVSLDGDGCASKSICIKDGRLMLYPMGFRFILR